MRQLLNFKLAALMTSAQLWISLSIIARNSAEELPPGVTAATGLDALTQLIEPYVCSRANPMTDALCVEGIRRAARSLRRPNHRFHQRQREKPPSGGGFSASRAA